MLRGLILYGVRSLIDKAEGEAHQLRVTIGKCISDLELLAQVGRPEDFANRVEYLRL
jgi:hypothetical protein